LPVGCKLLEQPRSAARGEYQHKIVRPHSILDEIFEQLARPMRTIEIHVQSVDYECQQSLDLFR
jgi:hypothetical protein